MYDYSNSVSKIAVFNRFHHGGWRLPQKNQNAEHHRGAVRAWWQEFWH
jgi:hypothetical protein